MEEHKDWLSCYLNLFIFKVEDGGRVCFSYDIWHRDVGLENQFPDLSLIEKKKDCSVA